MAKYQKNRCDRERPRCKPLGIGADCWTPKQIKLYGLDTRDISPERCLEDRQKEIEQLWRECIFTKLAEVYGASPYDEAQATREPREPPPPEEDDPNLVTVQKPKAKPTAAELKEADGAKTKGQREAEIKKKQDREFDKWEPSLTIPTPETDAAPTEEEPENGKPPPVPRKPDGDPDAFPDAEYFPSRIKYTIWEAITAAKAKCARKIQDDAVIQELRSCFCDEIDCGKEDDKEKITVRGPAPKNPDVGGVVSPADGTSLSSRLQELNVTGSAYGVPIEVHYGLTHSLGNIIYMQPTVDYLQDEQPLLAEIITGVARVTPYVIGPAISFALSIGATDPELDLYRVYFDNLVVFDADARTSSLGFFVGDELQKTSKLSLHNADTAIPEEMRADGIGYRDLSFLFFRNIDVTQFQAFPNIRVLLRRRDSASAPLVVAANSPSPIAHIIPVSDVQSIAVVEADNTFVRMTPEAALSVSVPGTNWRDTSEVSGGAFVSGKRVLPNGAVVAPLFTKTRLAGDGRNDMRVTFSESNVTTREAYVVVNDAVLEFKSATGAVLHTSVLPSAVVSATTATYVKDGVTFFSVFAATNSVLREIKLRSSGGLESPFEYFTDYALTLTHTLHSVVSSTRGLVFFGDQGMSIRGWDSEEYEFISNVPSNPIRVNTEHSRILFGNLTGVYALNVLTNTVTKVYNTAINSSQAFTGKVLFADNIISNTVSNAVLSLADVANDVLTRAMSQYSTVEEVTDFQALGVKLSTLEDQAALSRVFNYTAQERNELLSFDPDFASWVTVDKVGEDAARQQSSLKYFDVEGNIKETLNVGGVSTLSLPLYMDDSTARYLTGVINARLQVETKTTKVTLAPKYLNVAPHSVFSVTLGSDLVADVEAYGERPVFPEEVPAATPVAPAPVSTGFYPIYLDISPVFAEDGSSSTLRVSGYLGAVGAVDDLTILAFGDSGLLGSGTVVRAMNTGTLVTDGSIAYPDQFSFQNADTDYLIVNMPNTDRLYNFPRNRMNEATNTVDAYRNILAVGREWIRFTSFTSTGNPDEYRLEGLRRGLFNTEMYRSHTVGERIVHYDPGAFAPITFMKDRFVGEIGLSAFDNSNEETAPVTARYTVSKHTSLLPPNYGVKARDVYAGTVSIGQVYAIQVFPRNKLPVPLPDAASVYGEVAAPNRRYLWAWLTPGTIVDEALVRHVVDNANLRIPASSMILNQFISGEPRYFPETPITPLTLPAPLTVIWKTVTEDALNPYGHWTIGVLDFTNLDYPVKQRVFTLEEP